MKLITAVIKPFKLDELRQAVADIGIQGVTVTEVQGYGSWRGRVETYRGADYQIDFLPKAKVEFAVDDSIAEQVIEAVAMSLGPAPLRMERSGYLNLNRPCGFAPEKPVRTPFDDLGASRAGKPANSPVGAISRGAGP
jgi:nitrogen regulatory protein PII